MSIQNGLLNFLFLSLIIIALKSGQYECSNPLKHITLDAQLSEIQRRVTTLDSSRLSQSLLDHLDNRCVGNFVEIIKRFPSPIQNVIVNHFVNATRNNLTTCCLAADLIRDVQPMIDEQLANFTHLIGNTSSESKEGLGCFKTPEIFNKTNLITSDKDTIKDNDKFIKEMLKMTNKLNSRMAECMTTLRNVALTNIGLMCASNTLLDKLFIKSTVLNQYLSPMPRKDVDLAVYDSCYKYVSEWNVYSDSLMSSFINIYNYIQGVDTCNYFSPMFSFDKKDDEDTLYPKSALKNKTSMLNVTFEEMTNNLFDCLGANKLGERSSLEILKIAILNSEKENPNRLSTNIGRDNINFDIIKKTFILEEKPSFYVSCFNKTCQALCENCTSIEWDKNNVLKDPTTSLDVACCKGVCVVYVSSLVNVNGIITRVNGAEVFHTSPNKRYLSDFDLVKLKSASKCIKNQNKLDKDNKSDYSNFWGKYNSIMNSEKPIEVDPRLVLALNLNISIAGVDSLATLFFNNVTKYDSDHVFVRCENASCKVECDNCPLTNFTIYPFVNETLSDTQRLLVQTNSTNVNFLASEVKVTQPLQTSAKYNFYLHNMRPQTRVNFSPNFMIMNKNKLKQKSLNSSVRSNQTTLNPTWVHNLNGDYIQRHLTLFNNYGIEKHRFNFYRPPSANTKLPAATDPYLKAQADPAYWFIGVSTPKSTADYMKRINSSFNDLKINVDCCRSFCVIYIDPITKKKSDEPNKIFIDVIQRRLNFFNTDALTLTQKKCLVKEIFINTEDPKLNALSNCRINSEIDFLPTKQSCNKQITGYCSKIGFPLLIERVTPFVESRGLAASCKAPALCEDLDKSTITDNQKLLCGNSLVSMFTKFGFTLRYQGLATPCNNAQDSIPSFLQQERVNYVDETQLNENEKSEYRGTQNAVSVYNTTMIQIDGSNANKTNKDNDLILGNINFQANIAAGTNNSSYYYVSRFLALLIIVLVI